MQSTGKDWRAAALETVQNNGILWVGRFVVVRRWQEVERMAAKLHHRVYNEYACSICVRI